MPVLAESICIKVLLDTNATAVRRANGAYFACSLETHSILPDPSALPYHPRGIPWSLSAGLINPSATA